MAEGILRHLIQQEKGATWTVDSAAMVSYHIDHPPHPSSQKVCKEHGIDISGQRARLFKKADMKQFDKIYAMSTDVLQMIKELCGKKFDANKTSLFLNELHPGKNESVPDPWFGSEKDYYPVYDLIEETCIKIVKKYTAIQN